MEIQTLIQKLNHKIPEIRRRAIEALRIKLSTNFITTTDLIQEKSLPRALLESLNFDGCNDFILNLVSILTEHPSSRKLLNEIHAAEFFREMKMDTPHDKIDEILQNLQNLTEKDPVSDLKSFYEFKIPIVPRIQNSISTFFQYKTLSEYDNCLLHHFSSILDEASGINATEISSLYPEIELLFEIITNDIGATIFLQNPKFLISIIENIFTIQTHALFCLNLLEKLFHRLAIAFSASCDIFKYSSSIPKVYSTDDLVDGEQSFFSLPYACHFVFFKLLHLLKDFGLVRSVLKVFYHLLPFIRIYILSLDQQLIYSLSYIAGVREILEEHAKYKLISSDLNTLELIETFEIDLICLLADVSSAKGRVELWKNISFLCCSPFLCRIPSILSKMEQLPSFILLFFLRHQNKKVRLEYLRSGIKLTDNVVKDIILHCIYDGDSEVITSLFNIRLETWPFLYY